MQTEAGDVLVSVSDVKVGDVITVNTGNMIPLDGKVVDGEAMINHASITGEPLPVRRCEGGYVYAGTVVEEGSCSVRVEKCSGAGRYDRIVKMIEESESSSPGRRARRRIWRTALCRTVSALRRSSGSSRATPPARSPC